MPGFEPGLPLPGIEPKVLSSEQPPRLIRPYGGPGRAPPPELLLAKQMFS